MSDTSEINLTDFEYKPDTFGTIRAIGIDKYPGEMQIIRELIQNADDATAKSMSFRINEGEIIIENDGNPFTKPCDVDNKEESDFYRISHIGLGKVDEEVTGTFGIGFTSVFHITDYPRIMSNGLNFKIRVNELPIVKKIPFDKITKLCLPIRSIETELSKKIKAEPFDQKKLEAFEKQLIHETYKDIFFLRAIQKIEAYKENTKLFSISRKSEKTEKIT